jgi:hypothetical protein
MSTMEVNVVNSKATKSAAIQNAAKLDATTAISLETNGVGYITQKGLRYVPFLDSKDNFFQILVEAGLLSPTNKACINSKTKFSIGKGWMLMDGKIDDKLNEWTKSVNKKGDSLNDILRKIFNNYFVCGNSFIELVRCKIGSSIYIKVYVRNVVDCRVEMPDDEDDIPKKVFVSKEFRKKGVWSMKKDSAIEIPIYNGDKNQKWYKDGKGNEHIIFHLKNEETGYDYYGMPTNVACLPQQILEYKMARHNLDEFDNNLVIGGVIVLEGNLTQDEANKLGKNIISTHSGDGKRGRYVILSSQNGITNTKILPFDKGQEYDYVEGSKRMEEQIFLTNEWSKALIDPQSSGMSNSGKQIKEIYETKMNTVIGPVQQFVIEKFLQPLMNICDASLNTKWSAYQFGINNIPALGISSDIDVNGVLTIDEGREALGYEEITDGSGKQVIGAKKSTDNQKVKDVRN